MFTFLDFLFGSDRHKFTVRKAYCTPCRSALLTALQPYSIQIHDLSETIVRDMYGRPKYEQAEFFVSKAQSNWTEYLLYRSRQFVVVSGFVNPANNQKWAAKHDSMPRPWSTKNGVWIEKSCSLAALKNRR